MSIGNTPLVTAYTTAIQKLLQQSRGLEHKPSIDVLLSTSQLKDGSRDVADIRASQNPGNQQAHYAAIETAFRSIFSSLITSTIITESSFNQVWSLLDILSMLSDTEQCEPVLTFWLIEELLDSQTVDGCRRVFDYLELRRERLTAKHFKAKNLVILRACNELLRRLSRAEDTVFCGRVFIFLFQSFPLGDRSSVNLRGEYHVENITVFDDLSASAMQGPRATEFNKTDSSNSLGDQISSSNTIATQYSNNDEVMKEALPSTKSQEDQIPVPNMDTLYPIFWSLQNFFSTPTKLFDPSNLTAFKNGLQLTLKKFKQVDKELESNGSSRNPEENKRGAKRKRGGSGEDLAASFNPKYLTSRDLFELEVSDLAFRRHVLVQALILIDFLLSLTPKAKGKLETMSNKAVLYSYTINDEDAKWATLTRGDIATYLQQGIEGKFYYRMVDTVLSRDKNWVRWKIENCPPIQRNSVSADEYVTAKSGAQKACATKRLRATPLGSLDLSFLSEGEKLDGLRKLEDSDRYTVPTMNSFRAPIADDEFDMEMAKSDEERRAAANTRSSKLWRTLRIASKSKLNLFDRIDDGNNLQALFDVPGDENGGKKASENGEGGIDEQAGNVAFGRNSSPRNEIDSVATQEATVK